MPIIWILIGGLAKDLDGLTNTTFANHKKFMALLKNSIIILRKIIMMVMLKMIFWQMNRKLNDVANNIKDIVSLLAG